MKIVCAILMFCIPLILSISESKQQDYGLLQPFYCVLDGKTYFIAYDGDEKNERWHFKWGKKYGIEDDKKNRLLPVEYEKIYNPNMTLLDCFEIKRNGKVGMLNYKTGEILEPRFEYIIPSGKMPTPVAYGFSNGAFYEIDASDLGDIKPAQFDLQTSLSELEFDVTSHSGKYFQYSYAKASSEKARQKVLIVPSWIEVHDLMQGQVFWDLIIDENSKNNDLGTSGVTIKSRVEKPLTDKLRAFILDIFEKGVAIRDDYQESQERLVVLNTENNLLSTVKLTESDYFTDTFCRSSHYRSISNQLIEVETNISSSYENKEIDSLRYDTIETVFRHWIIKDNGKVELFKSNRYYDFTKIVMINEQYLRGCFIRSNPSDDPSGLFHTKTKHLSIDDLDLMRNEIFADYGYRFKTDKWQRYFAKRSWYEPKFDDVTDQLTDIDKANIQFILKIKKQMIGNEEKYTQPNKGNYVPAG